VYKPPVIRTVVDVCTHDDDFVLGHVRRVAFSLEGQFVEDRLEGVSRLDHSLFQYSVHLQFRLGRTATVGSV
jgi:hypothetical protein